MEAISIINVACISYNKTSLTNLHHSNIIINYFDDLEKIDYDNYNFVIILNDQNNVDVIRCLKKIRKVFDKIVYIIDFKYDETILKSAFANNVNDYFTFPIKNEYLIQKILQDINKLNKDYLDYYKYKDLVVDFNSIEVFINGEIVNLTKIEFKLLKILIRNVNSPVHKKEIVKGIWNYETNDYRTLETHIKTLRKKLKDYKINVVTIWSYGYSFIEKG